MSEMKTCGGAESEGEVSVKGHGRDGGRECKKKKGCVGGGGTAASGGLEAHASAQPILSSPRRAWPRAAGASAGRQRPGEARAAVFYRGLSPPHSLPCTRAPGPATTPHPMSASHLQAAHGLQLRHGVGWRRREGRPLDGENKKGGGQQKKKRCARGRAGARRLCGGVDQNLLAFQHSLSPARRNSAHALHAHTHITPKHSLTHSINSLTQTNAKKHSNQPIKSCAPLPQARAPAPGPGGKGPHLVSACSLRFFFSLCSLKTYIKTRGGGSGTMPPPPRVRRGGGGDWA